MSFSNYWETALTWLFTVGLQMLIIIAMMVVALKGTDFVSRRISKLFKRGKEQTELRKRADTLTSVIRYILTVIVYGIGGMMLLQKINVNVGPLLAGAGVIGVAIGFGAQDLVKDLISGLYMLLEDQIRVGDVVEIAGKSGMVERVTLRMVVLRDQAGSVHYIRNAKIDTVKNMTKDFSFHVFDISVGYNEDADRVVEVIEELGTELQNDPAFSNDIIAPIEIFGLDKIGDTSLTIKGRIKTRPIKQWKVGREFNRRLKKRFVELGIAPPSTVQAVQMMPAVALEKEEKALEKMVEIEETTVEPASAVEVQTADGKFVDNAKNKPAVIIDPEVSRELAVNRIANKVSESTVVPAQQKNISKKTSVSLPALNAPQRQPQMVARNQQVGQTLRGEESDAVKATKTQVLPPVRESGQRRQG